MDVAAIDHVNLRVPAAGVDVEMELDAPLGATGRAPAVYVEDPFGYRSELKTTG